MGNQFGLVIQVVMVNFSQSKIRKGLASNQNNFDCDTYKLRESPENFNYQAIDGNTIVAGVMT